MDGGGGGRRGEGGRENRERVPLALGVGVKGNRQECCARGARDASTHRPKGLPRVC